MLKRIISVVLCLVLALSLCGCDMIDYKKAVMLYEGGGYEGAKELFEALGDHEDSAEYAAKAQLVLDYRNAVELYAEENYAEAKTLFEALGDYEKSKEYLAKIEDKLLADKIVGRWKTEEIDMTNIFVGYIKEELAAAGYPEIDFDDNIETLSYSAYYIFEDYGVVKTEIVEDSFSKFFESVLKLYIDAMVFTTEQELIAVAEEYGITLDEVYASLEVKDAKEYLEQTLGMSIEEFIGLVFDEETLEAILYESVVNGAWYMRDDVIYMVAGHEIEKAEYDPDSDTITVLELETDSSASESATLPYEEMKILYPYTMTRADKAKPAA